MELTDIPHDAQHLASTVISDVVVTSAPLDELVDYDDNSVQSIQDNELAPTTSMSDPSQRQSEEPEVLPPAEPLKRRKIDMGELMVKTNVTKRAGLGKPLSQFKAPKRSEITRLPTYDVAEGSPTATGKVFSEGSGKDGRPIVEDLVRERENESRLVQEFVDW